MIPDTKEGLQDAGRVYDNDGICRACEEPIEWWLTPSGKKMPMSLIEEKDCPLSPIKKLKRISHFANCEFVNAFRRRK